METEVEDDLAAALVNDKTAACSRADVLNNAQVAAHGLPNR
jgi:hypothetical protein